MFAEIGNFLSYIALMLAVVLIALPYIKTKSNYINLIAIAQFSALSTAFACLIISFMISDFSVQVVANNSHTIKPLVYKVSAAWGNHEGSLLMWVCSLSLFSIIFLLSARDELFKSATMSVQNMLIFLFLFLMLATSNPFDRLFPAPLNGLGLNPILQDIGLAFHPPVLYIGYVGFSIAFSAALGALFAGTNYSVLSYSILNPIRISWSFLTLGIMLGSWWAYRELGWGGFWFWDPVENSSLMPWLSGTALLHAVISTKRTGHFKALVYVLSLFTFILSVVGTFLVRSGIITSVHSFASDPKRGVFILAILAIISVIALASSIRFLFVEKSNRIEKINLISKSGLIALNNFILIFFASVVTVGTVYPLILELFTLDKISVGAPYFNAYLFYLTPLLLFICVCSYFVHWKGFANKFEYVVCFIAVGISGLIIKFAQVYSVSFVIIILLSVYLVLINLNELRKKFAPYKLGHLGFAIVCFSITLNTALQKETELVAKIKKPIEFSGFQITLNSIDYEKGPNYVTRIGNFDAYKDGVYIGNILPELRFFVVEQQQVAESDILHKLFYDLYLTIGELKSEDEVVVRLNYKPMMNFLWLGGLLISIAGVSVIAINIFRSLNVGLRRLFR